MGRLEAFAMSNKPAFFLDGMKRFGYGLILVIVSMIGNYLVLRTDGVSYHSRVHLQIRLF
jgi:Na+-transporting NADH:ubiquinone oxidoreductase subunit NqrD